MEAKNVALVIADKICDSVSEKLVGETFSTFNGNYFIVYFLGVSKIVHSSMEISLTNILTPKRDIKILNDIKANKKARPYIIVFCGVNGVGKSTNLAKIAYYLLNNNQKVLIAACDTFRSGAVEQLRTHVCKFNSMFPSNDSGELPKCVLFDKGYGKDSASVASEAIKTGF
ncbi:hypothetical protein HZS_1856 [Henneguya salminicola]|nr:hypothetical protein HZS_1856 [Henneguya salminicola]